MEMFNSVFTKPALFASVIMIWDPLKSYKNKYCYLNLLSVLQLWHQTDNKKRALKRKLFIKNECHYWREIQEELLVDPHINVKSNTELV